MTANYQLGLLGYPVGHSLSPCLHQAALQACRLEGEYRLFEIMPGAQSEAAIRHLLEQVRLGEIQGLNVTIPYKQTVLPMLDELGDSARGIVAVNTIYLTRGALVGENTDAAGFLTDLRQQMASAGWQAAEDSQALVLGAGGSARAVVYELLQAGWRVRVAGRRIEQAVELVRSLRASTGSLARLSGLELTPGSLAGFLAKSRVELIVNTTPLGMASDRQSSPWPEGISFPGEAFLYDLVYNPAQTVLMRAARQAGLSVAGGIGMLIEQAALAFTIWTGCSPPRQAMQQAAETYFRERIATLP